MRDKEINFQIRVTNRLCKFASKVLPHGGGELVCQHPDSTAEICSKDNCPILKEQGSLVERLKELKEKNPYPEDIYLERTDEEWEQFHNVLGMEGLSGDGYMGCCSRRVWNTALDKAIELIEELEEE